MIAPLASIATFRLFSPLIVATAFALFIFALGRVIATRKFTRGLDPEDDEIRPPSPSRDGVPTAIDFEPTRKFVRAKPIAPPADDDLDETTQHFERRYLEAADLIEC